MHSLVTDKASEICSRLRALMGGNLADSQPMFVHFHLNEVSWCQFYKLFNAYSQL